MQTGLGSAREIELRHTALINHYKFKWNLYSRNLILENLLPATFQVLVVGRSVILIFSAVGFITRSDLGPARAADTQ